MANESIKSKIEILVLESHKKSKENNHKNLNFSFPKNRTTSAYLKDKLKVFKNLDEYSQTFLSIHTRAKIALREFKQNYFEGSYLELLRLVLTLPESLNNKNLKSKSVTNIENTSFTNDKKNEVKNNTNSNEVNKNSEIRSNTILLKTGMSGKQMQKEKEKFKAEQEELMNISFDNFESDEDFDDEESNVENFNSKDFEDINL